MGTSTREATENLTTQRNELMKQFHVYDGEGRLIEVYTAGYRAGAGTTCTKVTYEYVGPGSVLIEKMRESNDVWDASYD